MSDDFKILPHENEIDEPLDEEEAISIINNMPDPPEVRHAFMNEPPYYDHGLDYISVSKRDQYDSDEEYYAAIFHELIHSTSHVDRLNRNPKAYDNDVKARAREELIAEMGAAILGSKVGIELDEMDNPSKYIKHWSEQLPSGRGAFDEEVLPEKTKKMLRAALDEAERAVDYILSSDGSKKMRRAMPEAIMPPTISMHSCKTKKKPKPPGFIPKLPGRRRGR